MHEPPETEVVGEPVDLHIGSGGVTVMDLGCRVPEEQVPDFAVLGWAHRRAGSDEPDSWYRQAELLPGRGHR